MVCKEFMRGSCRASWRNLSDCEILKGGRSKGDGKTALQAGPTKHFPIVLAENAVECGCLSSLNASYHTTAYASALQCKFGVQGGPCRQCLAAARLLESVRCLQPCSAQ